MEFQVNAGFHDLHAFAFQQLSLQGGVGFADEDFSAFADNAVALIGGRNIGNQYFQIDPESQFADDDVFTAGPIVRELSGTFDEFWNSDLAIPARALKRTAPPDTGTAT